jgi:tripartite-type tricarboxylate transporter receptor subunit TctC
MATDAAFSQNQYLFAKLPYDPVDGFAPVTRMVTFNMILFVPANFPATNVREFVAYVKSHPSRVSYGSAGTGGITHLAMVDLQKRESLDMTHAPYKGLAPVIQDMLSGQIQAAFGAVSAVEPHIRSGKLKALAIAGSQRATILPDVPTFAESGYAYVQAIVNVGLLAPKGTRPEVVNAIAAGTRKVIGEAQFREKYIDSVAFEMIGSSPKEFEAFIINDRPLQKRRIELSGAGLN